MAALLPLLSLLVLAACAPAAQRPPLQAAVAPAAPGEAPRPAAGTAPAAGPQASPPAPAAAGGPLQAPAAVAGPQAPPSAPAAEGELLLTGKRLRTVTVSGSESLHDDGTHDTRNEALVALQDPREAMADFPRDRRLQVDWVATLRQGLIRPRAELTREGEMEVLDLDILMKNTQFMPYVKFPHRAHTEWLACSNCHPAIFEAKEGANPITMNKVLRGQYCGVCHDKVAFSLFLCERCHSVPHAESGKWW